MMRMIRAALAAVSKRRWFDAQLRAATSSEEERDEVRRGAILIAQSGATYEQVSEALMAIVRLPPSPARFRSMIEDERLRQHEKGYTPEHDRAHGVHHLLTWAQEYSRRGEGLKAAALNEAAREILDGGEVFERLADALGAHPQAVNHEIADSGEYETKLQGLVDVEELAAYLIPFLDLGPTGQVDR
jgi:hypothetical protein